MQMWHKQPFGDNNQAQKIVNDKYVVENVFGAIVSSALAQKITFLNVLVAFLVCVSFFVFLFITLNPDNNIYLHSDYLREIKVFYQITLAIYVGFIAYSHFYVPKLVIATQQRVLSVFIVFSTLVLAFISYLFDIKSAVIGSYLSMLPLLCIILFGAEKLFTIVILNVLLWMCYLWLTSEHLLPYSMFFKANILSTHQGYYVYMLAINTHLIISIASMCLIYDQLILFRNEREFMLKSISETDDLTGLLNRTEAQHILKVAMTEASQTPEVPLSVILSDIDHFKKINDQYGHHVGDRVLVMYADILQQICQRYGQVGRFGGEEFLIILQGISLSEAGVIANAIRESFQSKIIQINDTEISNLTASFGVSVYAQHHTVESFYHQADQNLYKAKNSGRNCVVTDLERT